MHVHRNRRFAVLHSLVVLLWLVALVTPAAAQATTSVPDLPRTLPAPVPGGPQPTIAVTPFHGLPGDTIQVSGNAVATLPGVRLVWLVDGEMATAAVVDRIDATYAAELEVPAVAPGAIQICAAATGSEVAAFVCVPFTVDAPAPGSVQAQFPLAAARDGSALDARLTLYAKGGAAVATARFSANGSVTVANVPPGAYTAAVVGNVPFLVRNVAVRVGPGGAVTVPLTPVTGCAGAQVAAVRISPSGPATSQYDFGPFIAGAFVTIPMQIQADLQIVAGRNVNQVSWKTNRWGISAFSSAPLQGTTFQADAVSSGALFFYDAVAGLETLTVRPHISGVDPACDGLATTRTIYLVANPFALNAFTYDICCHSYIPLSWNGNGYDFTLATPTRFDYDQMIGPYNYDAVSVDLPLAFPDPAPEFPLVGRLTNSFNIAFLVKGHIDLDGSVHFTATQARYRAFLFGTGPFSDTVTFMPPELVGGGVGTTQRYLTTLRPMGRGGDSLIFDQLKNMISFPLDETLAEFAEEVPVYSAILLNNPPLALVTLTVNVGASGELVLTGTIKPLVPDYDLTLNAAIEPYVALDLTVDVLFGIAEGGARAITKGYLGVPIRLNTSTTTPVFSVDPCFRISIITHIWFRVLFFRYDEEETIAEHSEGACPAAARAADALAPLPALLASPAVAAAPDGRGLLAYVADTTESAAQPTMRIFARFQNEESGEWGPEMAVSNGAHPVQHPVVAFAGPDRRPLVVWVETVVSRSEAAALADDPIGAARRQELYASTWDGAAWSQPERLTDDALADGMPALAGDALGATLAWTRNTSAAITADASRIAVMAWQGGAWSALGLLPAANGSFNRAVAVARAPLDATHAREVVAWTADADADAATPTDRKLVVARRDAAADPWTLETVSALPTGVETPDIAVDPADPDRAFAAFVVPSANGDGSAGGAGNRSAVWTARRGADGVWTASVLRDAAGAVVRGQEPALHIDAEGRALLLMRQFGQAGTNAELGQIALTQLTSDGQAASPLYLTDAPQQQWQPALAIDPTTGEALAVSVQRPSDPGRKPLRAAARGAAVDLPTARFATTGDTVEVRTVEPGADPALDPVLQLSQAHAPLGADVVISATVRNLGRAETTPVVRFYRGVPGSGELVDSVAITEALAFNQAQIVHISLPSLGGDQPLYAEVVADDNTGSGNDRATANLGSLDAPTHLVATPLEGAPAVRLAWQPAQNVGIAGYRILRRLDNQTRLELVGESVEAGHIDLLLRAGAGYCYRVQAFDTHGVRSPSSPESCTRVPAYRLYLPAMVD